MPLVFQAANKPRLSGNGAEEDNPGIGGSNSKWAIFNWSYWQEYHSVIWIFYIIIFKKSKTIFSISKKIIFQVQRRQLRRTKYDLIAKPGQPAVPTEVSSTYDNPGSNNDADDDDGDVVILDSDVFGVTRGRGNDHVVDDL